MELIPVGSPGRSSTHSDRPIDISPVLIQNHVDSSRTRALCAVVYGAMTPRACLLTQTWSNDPTSLMERANTVFACHPSVRGPRKNSGLFVESFAETPRDLCLRHRA